MSEFQLFIDGQYQAAASGKTARSVNPANGEVYASVQLADADDAKRAIASAQEAFAGWSEMAPSQKELIFFRASEIILSRKQELVDLLVDEAGSTLLKAGYEVHTASEFARGIAGDCRRVYGETYRANAPGVNLSYSIRRPLGVVLAITPFNFPLLLGIRKIGWALAAGNCVLLKPSEVTPVVGLKIGEIFSEAGLPSGVLNVIPAEGADLGDAVIADPRVKMVTFTGSSRVGKKIGQTAAGYNKKFALEMGGKNPVIVLNDADVDYAVDAAAFSNYMHQGQVCMTGSRVIVEAGVYAEFCEKFASKVAGLKVGNPREPGVIIGPLIRDSQPAFIQEKVDQAVAQGAGLLTGGSYLENFYQPTVLADVTQSMDIFRCECFGPVASVVEARDHRHAIDLANDSDYGLSSAVFTNDLEKAMEITERIESGMVHVNGPSIRDDVVVPFGGVKDSGMGREGGHHAMDEFTELKWVTVQMGRQKFPF